MSNVNPIRCYPRTTETGFQLRCNSFPAESYDLFALGILDDIEAEQIRLHVRANCSDCVGNLRESLERAAQIGLSAPAVRPPHSLRGRIVGLVKPQPAGWKNWLRFAPGALIVAASLITIGVASFRLSRSKPDSTPVIISRLSPPPVPIVQPPSAALPAGPTPQLILPRQPLKSEQVPVLQSSTELAAKQSQIAELEAAVREKDQQLEAAGRQLSTLQASVRAPSQDAAADSQSRIASLTQQVELYKTALEEQRRELNRNVQLVSLLSVPDLKVLNLAATEQGGGASARAMVTSRSAIFFATRLPGLQPGRSYQLWLMRRASPAIVSAGVFRPDQTSAAMLEIKDAASLAGLTAMAVTEEPAGGSPLPTGHKILIGLAKS